METYRSYSKPQHRGTCVAYTWRWCLLEGGEILLHSLTSVCSPLVCFSMSGNRVIRQDGSCDTLTVDVSAALGGDQLSWPHSQMPSSLKTQAAAHNNLLLSLWQATASKALLEVGENNAWQWRVSHPTAVPVPQPSSSCSCPTLPGLGSPAWPAWCPEGMLQCSLCSSGTPLPLLQVACLGVGQAKGLRRAASAPRHLHVVPKNGHCRDLLFTFLLNKLSLIIALALELKVSGVMNNCYF